jgi:AcrR family transcriptional regulator
VVPRLWTETIEAHRREVRDAILATTVALVAQHGLRSVTMSQIAEETGIGRATLYKYFSGVEAILLAWHDHQITGHFQHLAEIRDQAGGAGQRLEAVLRAYALITHESYGHHDTELAAFLHRDEQVGGAEQHLRHMIRELITQGQESGMVRDDVAAEELASYCLHALGAARSLPSKAAVRRLVTVTLAGVRPGTNEASKGAVSPNALTSRTYPVGVSSAGPGKPAIKRGRTSRAPPRIAGGSVVSRTSNVAPPK